VDDRRSIGGIIHVLRIGCRRKDGPPADGPSTPVCNRFNRWSHRSLWGRFFAALAAQAELPDDLNIDSTAGRTRHSAYGGNAGRRSGPTGARLAVQLSKSMP
jgi:transposase